MTENIDRYYRERLEDYVETPAPDTWDNIAMRLGHEGKKKAMILFWRIAAGMALLISLSVFIQDTQKQIPANVTGDISSKPELLKETDFVNNEAKQITAIKETSENVASPVEKPGAKRAETNLITEFNETPATQNISTEAIDNEIIQPIIHAGQNDVEFSKVQIVNDEDYIAFLKPKSADIFVAERPGIVESGISVKQSGVITELVYTLDQLLAMNEPEPVERSDKNKWTIGGQFAPQYSYRNIVSEEYPEYVLNQINSSESSVITYSGGLNIALSPNKRLSVQSGIYYSRYGQLKSDLVQFALTKGVFLDQLPNTGWEPDYGTETQQIVYLNNSTGNVTLNSKASASINQSPSNNYDRRVTSENNIISTEKPLNSIAHYFEYLEVPVNLRYKVIDRKIGFSLIGGLSTNFLVGTSINLNYSDNSKENISRSTSDLTQINYSGSVGFGIEYPLIKNFLLTIEPKFKYYLNPIDKEPNTDIHPYALGIYTGFNYKF